MPNPPYCRFQNTLADLKDCRDALHERESFRPPLSVEELDALWSLLKLCHELADKYYFKSEAKNG